jgi:trehalose 6-phosphate phosphatase
MPATPPTPLLSLAQDIALLLDFDGTLVELAETPEAILVPESLPALLRRLSGRLQGRVALVTGRALADLDRYLPGLSAAGSHGLELRFADGRRAPHGRAVPEGLLGDAVRFAASDPGLRVEEKPGGLALHYRLAPDRAAEAEAWADEAAGRHGLRVQPGKMVLELLPRGVDKGEAVRRLMAEPPFAGARPVFVGDDLTDEHGFEAAAALGGAGILVGPPRETAARWHLPDVAAVHGWLEAAADG